MTELDVACTSADGQWTCDVAISDDDGTTTHHVVGLTGADMERLAPGAVDPHELVVRSFRFLLVREPKESILTTFDLPVIGRYFPEFEREIRG
jgi:hypothetical protein